MVTDQKLIYMVFAIEEYYPSGGMSDCVGVRHTMEEAVQCADTIRSHGSVEIWSMNMQTLEYQCEEYERPPRPAPTPELLEVSAKMKQRLVDNVAKSNPLVAHSLRFATTSKQYGKLNATAAFISSGIKPDAKE
jgi:hypothetical protein